MKKKNIRVTLIGFLLVGLLGSMSSCTTDYVTGRKTFSLISESQEVAMGKEADPQIVAEYGVYDDPDLAAYVSNLGKQLAEKSHRPQLEYTFRLLDSPVVNAFALPGGYVYVTRGILAHFNSEDELAGVLGHEIGHVVARHSAEQLSRQQLAGLGLGLGVVLWEDFRPYAEMAGASLNLLLLKYSRGQESESDMLGVEYSSKLGYDARDMAGFFGTLKALGAESGQSLPSFMSTHPDPGDREVRVNRLAGEAQQKAGYKPLNVDRYEYLRRIDGIVYGDDPRQGYVENNVFYHPEMRFQFPVPADWIVMNTPSTVLMASPDKKAVIQLTLGKADSPALEADEFVAGEGITVIARRNTSVRGFTAVILETQIASQDGLIRVLSYFIQKDNHVYVFHGYSLTEQFAGYSQTFVSVMGGFDKVTDQTVLNKQPSRLRVRKVTTGGSLESVLRQMGVPEAKLSELAIVNGKKLSDPVKTGEWVKTVGN
ncbi:MAG: M48 family metalloprotease [Candidatus Latescibacterota bacterium]|nr:MAG: M48 family metalloprotease [Candidatus Latescibacterota bacterium]